MCSLSIKKSLIYVGDGHLRLVGFGLFTLLLETSQPMGLSEDII